MLLTALLEKQGLAPLHGILTDLGGWPVLDNYDKRFSYWEESLFNGYLINIDIGVDLKNSTKHVLTVRYLTENLT